MIVVVTLIRIGRRRLRADSASARRASRPAARKLFAWCTIRMALFTTSPVRITKPSIAITSNVAWPPLSSEARRMPTRPPERARGTLTRITAGVSQLRKRATSRR